MRILSKIMHFMYAFKWKCPYEEERMIPWWTWPYFILHEMSTWRILEVTWHAHTLLTTIKTMTFYLFFVFYLSYVGRMIVHWGNGLFYISLYLYIFTRVRSLNGIFNIFNSDLVMYNNKNRPLQIFYFIFD